MNMNQDEIKEILKGIQTTLRLILSVLSFLIGFALSKIL